MQIFLRDRVRLVRELAAGRSGASYADLVLILTAVISACAAKRWPGKGIDRKRFVELLVQCSPSHAHCGHVSVPSLLNSKLVSESNTPWGDPGCSTRILRDDEIDLSVRDSSVRFPGLPTSILKNHSYAHLIYTWLRCAYSHEYIIASQATEWPSSRRVARISYIGRKVGDTQLVRIASFHLDYLISLAEHHAQQLADRPHPLPATWWLDISEPDAARKGGG